MPAGVGGGYQPSWSPDGAWLAFTNLYDIFVVPATGGNAIKLTNGTTSYFLYAPAWSPDGGQIAFIRRTSGASELDVMNRDGSGVRALSNHAAHDLSHTDPLGMNVDHPAWSPDGSRIAFTCEIDLNNLDVCAINRDGTGLVRLTNDPAADWSPVWSPDGTRIAFSAGRFGGDVLALMNDDGSGVSQIGTKFTVGREAGHLTARKSLSPLSENRSSAVTRRAEPIATSRMPFTRRHRTAQWSGCRLGRRSGLDADASPGRRIHVRLQWEHLRL